MLFVEPTLTTEAIEAVCGLLPERPKAYFEPYFGTGAVFFQLVKTGRLDSVRQVLLNDPDEHLMQVYEDIKFDPGDVHEKLQELYKPYAKWPKSTYETIQLYWNQRRYSSAKYLLLRLAARDETWSLSTTGKHEIPWGGKERLVLPMLQDLQAISRAFQRVDTDCFSANAAMMHLDFLAEPGTAVFVNTPASILPVWLRCLISSCAAWDAKGAHVVVRVQVGWFGLLAELLSVLWPMAILGQRSNEQFIVSRSIDTGTVSAMTGTTPA